MKRKLISLLLIASVLLCLLPSCGKKSAEVVIEVADFGSVTVHIATDKAPETAANFLKLVDEGFYDALTFHRILSGFMIQGGDPNKNGTGDSGKNIKGEFSLNGFNNSISHVRGVISMARTSNSYDSATSQFFICQQAATHLDGAYAAFGWVTEGMDVVDAIVEYIENNPSYLRDNDGGVYDDYQPVITSVKRVK